MRMSLGRQQNRAIGGGQRLREEKSLCLIALVRAQKRKLLDRFHTFCDHFEVQAVRHGDDSASDRGVVRIYRDVPHEGPVDLERVDRETLQVTQTRIAGTEIIDGHAYAK